MKQFCLTCDKVFYPTDNNFIGYPFKNGHWDHELSRYIFSETNVSSRVFQSRCCMEDFLCEHTDILTPIYKQLKEREANNARTREDQTERTEATSS